MYAGRQKANRGMEKVKGKVLLGENQRKTPTLEGSSHVISASGKNHKDRVLFLRDENQCGTSRSVRKYASSIHPF